MEILVFLKRKGCPECDKLKGEMEKQGIAMEGVTVYYTDTIVGMAEGAFHDVRSTPTLLAMEGRQELERLTEVEDIVTFLKGRYDAAEHKEVERGDGAEAL